MSQLEQHIDQPFSQETQCNGGAPEPKFACPTVIVGSPDCQRDTADYLSDMLLGLYRLAQSAQLHILLEPLESTYYKAHSLATQKNAPADHSDRLAKINSYHRANKGRPGA